MLVGLALLAGEDDTDECDDLDGYVGDSPDEDETGVVDGPLLGPAAWTTALRAPVIWAKSVSNGRRVLLLLYRDRKIEYFALEKFRVS